MPAGTSSQEASSSRKPFPCHRLLSGLIGIVTPGPGESPAPFGEAVGDGKIALGSVSGGKAILIVKIGYVRLS